MITKSGGSSSSSAPAAAAARNGKLLLFGDAHLTLKVSNMQMMNWNRLLKITHNQSQAQKL
jgi:hypothetical protein